MNIEEIKSLVQDAYGLEVIEIEKIKNVYKIKTHERYLCLKVIKYEFGHFLFIISAIKHLQANGFQKIPKIIETASGDDYIKLGNFYAYLTDWINAREADYDNPIDIIVAAGKLAELHIKSRGFSVTEEMHPRIGWFKWIETYSTRKNEILDFKNRIEKKDVKTEFDITYLSVMDDELQRAENAIYNIGKSDYILRMIREINLKGFCHHDFAHHNVLIDENGSVNIIDFDYCILDSILHDLSSLMMRCMKYGRWSVESAVFIMDAYSSINPIEPADKEIIAGFLEFPQDYWQVGIQYYWEKQPWGEEFFMKKLGKIIEDRDMRQDFIDEFRLIKYKNP